MRQTSKRARRSRLLMIFILVLLIALVLWGLAALADRLLHYGANATVSAKDADQPSAITPTPETADDTPKNTYDPACFYRDGEFLRYESSTVTSQIGIDVSAHQQDIDWQRVAASGVQFAILRVGYRGYTEGSIQEDAYFEQNLAGAIDAGLDVASISSPRPWTSRRRARKPASCWIRSPAISSPTPCFSTGRRSGPTPAATRWT